MNNQPIGFLDSGVGGLTVVRESLKQLTNETVYYIGDTARCPYGPRPVEQIREFTWDMVKFLLSKNVKMIVMACNTATAVVLDEVKEALDIPVVGVIKPGARAALKMTQNKRIGVIGTQGTINSDEYRLAIMRKSKEASVFGLACPKFVPLVESHEYNSETAKRVVENTLKDIKPYDVDTLVMGCTHYPLLKPLIQDAMGPEVTLIDSGAETVSEVSMLLDYYDISAEPTRTTKQHKFFTTGSPKNFSAISQEWLPIQSINVEKVTI